MFGFQPITNTIKNRVAAIEAATRGLTPKTGELTLKIQADGYQADATLKTWRDKQGQVRKVEALSEGESSLTWTLYFEAGSVLFAELIEDGRNGTRTERYAFGPGRRLVGFTGELKQGSKSSRTSKPDSKRPATFVAAEAQRILKEVTK